MSPKYSFMYFNCQWKKKSLLVLELSLDLFAVDFFSCWKCNCLKFAEMLCSYLIFSSFLWVCLKTCFSLFLSFFFCRSWSRRTSSWSRSWTSSATSSGRSTPCWPSGAEPHRHTCTRTHSYKTHMHTWGQDDLDITWTCDRVPHIGWGCTLQKKWGLWQYQPVSWRKRHETKEGRWEETNEDRSAWQRREVRHHHTIVTEGQGWWLSVLTKILSTSIFYIYITIMTLK